MYSRSKERLFFLAGALIYLRVGFCQGDLPASKLPEFDVASVKPSGSTFLRAPANTWVTMSVRGFRYTPGRLTCDQPLIAFIEEAYSLKSWQIEAPTWTHSEKYDFAAIMPANTSKDTARLMLRRMLADRFGFKAHSEDRNLPAYALVVGKKGFRLKRLENPGANSVTSGAGHLTAEAVSIPWLAKYLFAFVDRPVLDMTGIQGKYNINLSWTSEYDSPLMPGAPKRDRGILQSLEPMLGLRLEDRKLPTAVLVVDHLDRQPTPN